MNKLNHFINLNRFLFWEMVHTFKNRKIWAVIALILWTYMVAWIFNHYYFQSPVKQWQCFACRRGGVKIATVSAQLIEPTITPIPKTEKEIVMSMEHGVDLWKIYFIETNFGKTDGCRKEGKFGGFGVMSQEKPMCYDTFEKAVDRAEFWWKNTLEGHTKDEALCLYNLGKVIPMCSYSQTFNSL